MRFTVGPVVLLFASFVLIAVVVGCSSHRKSGVDFIANDAASVLHGRRLAISLAEPHNNADIWLLARGRLVEVTKEVRVATGGDGCYGGYGGGSGPCYRIAEPFSLSPDGKHLAFLLQDTEPAPDMTPPALIVSRSDGSHSHQAATGLGICPLCQVSTPSWDRNSRSFVIAVEQFDANDDSITKIYRIAIRSGAATLLSPAGTHSYSEDEPAISPDGREESHEGRTLPYPVWKRVEEQLLAGRGR